MLDLLAVWYWMPKRIVLCVRILLIAGAVWAIAWLAGWHLVAGVACTVFILSPVWLILVLVTGSGPPSTSMQEFLDSLELKRPSTCGACGYETEGLPDGAICPECGEPLPRMWSVRDSVIDPEAAERYGQPKRVEP